MSRIQRTAVITGSGQNIGRACATELAEAGFNIIVNGSTNKIACECVADEVRTIGTDAAVIMADIGVQSDIDRLTKQALQTFGTIDVLINNAAVRPAVAFLDMTDDDMEQVMSVNCYAAVRLARAFLPGMRERGWGRIVNFSGMNAQKGTGGRPHVTMSKHASWGLIKALAHEFGPEGITSNIISPGTFPGEGEDVSESSRFHALLQKTPVGRLGKAQDISTLIGLICSDRGGFINGQLLQVNGGVVG